MKDYMVLEAEVMALLEGREASVWSVSMAAWGYWASIRSEMV